jgi:hypothetical protein
MIFLQQRFPGRGRTLADGVMPSTREASEPDSGLQTRLLERDVPDANVEPVTVQNSR